MSNAILLSGGMDSISLAYWKKPSVAITVDYGQLPAQTEIRVSKTVSESLGIEHHVIKIDCSSLGAGDLVNKEQLAISPSTEWWPYRNQLLVTLALMKCIKLGVRELMVASVKSDGFHKDGTDTFYTLLNSLSAYQEGGIAVSSPCIHLTTAELIATSKVPRDILFWAHSCHKSNVACGNCRGCNKYAQVMKEVFYAK
jgi:7-cyano-7-deazaguanine synthase